MSIPELIEDYSARKKKLRWFDVNCWIGVTLPAQLGPERSLHETAAALSACGIQQAILSHRMAKDYDPATGTRFLVEAIAAHEQFFGAAVVAPDGAPGKQCDNYTRWLIAKKVRLVRLFPRAHNFLLTDWCAGEWLSVLESRRMPVVLWHTEAGWDEVAGVCRDHPKLPVIVEGPERKLLYHNRVYYRLLERFANFHLEIHNLVGYLGLDDLVRWFGSTRLLFGSYFPKQDPNAAMMLVTHGELSDADRENIARTNIERLIAEVEKE